MSIDTIHTIDIEVSIGTILLIGECIMLVSIVSIDTIDTIDIEVSIGTILLIGECIMLQCR